MSCGAGTLAGRQVRIAESSHQVAGGQPDDSPATATSPATAIGENTAAAKNPGTLDTESAAQHDHIASSWEEIVREHTGRVYRLAYRLTGNRQDAEDLTQDVFIRVFRSLHTFRPGTFAGWLHRITTNLFLDTVRRMQKIRFDGLGEVSNERLPSTTPAPGEHVAEDDLDHDVAAALANLRPDFRVAVVLCDIEGLSYEEIAADLGVRIGTVRSRIHRGRSQLRTALSYRRPTGRHRRHFGIDAESGTAARPKMMEAVDPA